jgi:hypothetical protein
MKVRKNQSFSIFYTKRLGRIDVSSVQISCNLVERLTRYKQKLNGVVFPESPCRHPCGLQVKSFFVCEQLPMLRFCIPTSMNINIIAGTFGVFFLVDRAFRNEASNTHQVFHQRANFKAAIFSTPVKTRVSNHPLTLMNRISVALYANLSTNTSHKSGLSRLSNEP